MTLLNILLLLTFTWQVLYRAYEQYYYINRTACALQRQMQDETLLRALETYGNAWLNQKGPINTQMHSLRKEVRCFVTYQLKGQKVLMVLELVFPDRTIKRVVEACAEMPI